MGYFQCRSPPRRRPMASDGGEKTFDPVLFDVTRIPCEDIANQITKDDFQVFQGIRPEEVNIENFGPIFAKKIFTAAMRSKNIFFNHS